MGVLAGALLAAVSGGITGVIVTSLRSNVSPRRSPALVAVLGAILGASGYGVFLAAGFVIALVMFGGPPDPWPAVLCVVLGCVAFLAVTWLQAVLAPRFGLGPPRDPSGRHRLQDLLDARPSGGPATMWLAGVGLAALPVLYGAQCVATQEGTLGRVLWHGTVHGGAAIALGVGWIGVGAFLHFHFFFGLHPGLSTFSRTGKLWALIGAFAGLGIAAVWAMVERAA